MNRYNKKCSSCTEYFLTRTYMPGGLKPNSKGTYLSRSLQTKFQQEFMLPEVLKQPQRKRTFQNVLKQTKGGLTHPVRSLWPGVWTVTEWWRHWENKNDDKELKGCQPIWKKQLAAIPLELVTLTLGILQLSLKRDLEKCKHFSFRVKYKVKRRRKKITFLSLWGGFLETWEKPRESVTSKEEMLGKVRRNWHSKGN